VLPYFRKAEDQERGEDEFHGVGGPLKVSDSRFRSEIIDAVIEAAVQAGIPRNPDFNGASQEGVGYYQSTVGNGRRWSTAVAYLKPARAGRTWSSRRTRTRRASSSRSGRAVGVEYRRRRPRDGPRQGEVIVSGGVYGSPQAAAAVGHRPGAHLKEMGVGRRARLPAVGANLHDHFNSYRRLARDQGGHAQRSRPLAHAQDRRRHPVCVRAQRAARRHQHAGRHLARSDPRFDRPDLQMNIFLWSIEKRDRIGDLCPQVAGLLDLAGPPEARGRGRREPQEPDR
jgi:choline dehydrogenase